MVFNTGIFLNMFDKNPLPCISLTETNLLFNFLQILHLAEIYGLLFLLLTVCRQNNIQNNPHKFEFIC